jgi:1,4-alpha-glucan branching enzyme
VLVTFRLPPEVKAESVHVVGEFNCWSSVAHPMTRDAEGLVAEVELDGGRRYRFRYLLDGDRWANDWAADDYVANDFGGDDSVIDLVTVREADARSI